jgi:hypothetical protein
LPQSSKKTGTYSICILGVRLWYLQDDQLVFRAQSEGELTMVLSIFSYLGIICNFNIIFNPVVGPTYHRISASCRLDVHNNGNLVEETRGGRRVTRVVRVLWVDTNTPPHSNMAQPNESGQWHPSRCTENPNTTGTKATIK